MTVTVAVGELCREALGGGGRGDPAGPSPGLSQAIRYYLADRGEGRSAWPYPKFLRGVEAADPAEGFEVSIEIDEAAWRDFSVEAERQGVSTRRLLQHAALYMAADRDSGRLTQ